MDYFNLVSDPLSQAADRASLCLFLRGDLQTAPRSVALAMTAADLAHPAGRIPSLAANWHWLAWVTRVGTVVLRAPRETIACDALVPLGWQTPGTDYETKKVVPFPAYSVADAQLVSSLRAMHCLAPDADLDPAGSFSAARRERLRLMARGAV